MEPFQIIYLKIKELKTKIKLIDISNYNNVKIK